MRIAVKQRLVLAFRSFALNLVMLTVIAIGGNCLASLYRRSHLPDGSELARWGLIALGMAITLTVMEQWPLWRARIPSRKT